MKHSISDIAIIASAIFWYSFFGICFLAWFYLQVKYVAKEISYKKSELSKKQLFIIAGFSILLTGSFLIYALI